MFFENAWLVIGDGGQHTDARQTKRLEKEKKKKKCVKQAHLLIHSGKEAKSVPHSAHKHKL